MAKKAINKISKKTKKEESKTENTKEDENKSTSSSASKSSFTSSSSEKVRRNTKKQGSKSKENLIKKNEIIEEKEPSKNKRSRRAVLNEKITYTDDIQFESKPSMSTFKPMLAETYDGSQEVVGWYCSEKLDGIRCIWNGSNLWSRNGLKFYPPKWFIEDFPKDCMLDGELFIKRNYFSETSSIIRKQYAHDGWKEVVYTVFDAPLCKGNLTKRLKYIEDLLKENNSKYIKLHVQEKVKSKEDIETKMDDLVANKAEGLIVRDPKSHYENRRSHTMLKVKRFLDAEATVIKHIKGTGRCSDIRCLTSKKRQRY